MWYYIDCTQMHEHQAGDAHTTRYPSFCTSEYMWHKSVSLWSNVHLRTRGQAQPTTFRLRLSSHRDLQTLHAITTSKTLHAITTSIPFARSRTLQPVMSCIHFTAYRLCRRHHSLSLVHPYSRKRDVHALRSRIHECAICAAGAS